MEFMGLIALIGIVLQITLFFWFIDTLGKIKVYLRDIRDIARKYDRNQ